MSETFGPSEIRALRGPLTPAELAARLGVSELAVRRWELPDDHPEARRPRRASRDKLRALARADRPVPPWVALVDRARLAQARDAALADRDPDPAWLRVALTTELLLGRGDALAARAALADPPPDGPAGARLHALSAWLFSLRDGRTGDPARALAHADRAGGDPEARALAAVARARTLDHAGDPEGAARAYGEAHGLGALGRCLAAEGHARALRLRGRLAEAAAAYRAVAERARALGLSLVEASSRAARGELSLLAAEDPADALSQGERARNVLRDARCEPGAIDLDAAAVVAEALARLGRTADARAVLEASEVVAARIRWSSSAVARAHLRLALHGLGPAPGPSGLTPAADALLRVAAVVNDPPAALRAAEEAALAGGCAVHDALAAVLVATLSPCEATLLALDRRLDRVPMPWIDAVAASARAAVLVRAGRGQEAVWALEAGAAVLERAGDRAELARLRLALAGLRGDAVLSAATRADLAQQGVALAPAWSPGPLSAPGSTADSGGVTLLHRVALRGVPASRIERELVTGAARVLPAGTAIELSELDDGGREWQLARRGVAEIEPPTFDRTFGDGTGRRLRLRAGPVEAPARERLEGACVVASLALALTHGDPHEERVDPERLAGLPDPVLVLAAPGARLGPLLATLHGDRPGLLVVHDEVSLGDGLVRAAGGTLVIRELGRLDAASQAVLARRLGDDGDVRIVAVTSAGPRALVGAGLLRADLVHRLSAEVLTLGAGWSGSARAPSDAGGGAVGG